MHSDNYSKMVDFGKRIAKKDNERKIHPVEIYQDLDRSSEAGPLRPIQEEVLNLWFQQYKDTQDVILKLHTGQGKTLVGLLILQSIINQEKGSCLYICPNIFLANQTIEQAKKFGIPYCLISKEGDLPIEFLSGNKILICHVQKVFNGLTKFGLNNQSVPVAGLILDDSHACIDSIKDAFTIKIPVESELYMGILGYFKEDLQKQRAGTYSEILEKVHESFLPIPYWSWIDKSNQITSYLTQHRDKDEIKFQWPLLKNSVRECQCFISGSHLEISPFINPIHQFGTFHNCRHRVLMSATTMNDSFFIKGLGLDKRAIVNPLTVKNEKWSGEKMVLIPYLIHESLNRTAIINQYAKASKGRNVGIVALIPSFNHKGLYEQQECTIVYAKSIDAELYKFKQGNFERPLVFVNRYDGIDLPDSTCRLLILDSKPYSESLSDKYEEICREESDLTNIKIAQKIEQGLGRSVRGEKDYSVIIITGGDLVNFIRNPKTQKYFSYQTRKQIEIGYEIAELASEDVNPNTTDMMKIVSDLIRQCVVHRDPLWKQFYEERMNSLKEEPRDFDIVEILEIERKAETLSINGQYYEACQQIQNLLNSKTFSNAEQGWYMQMMARFKYYENKLESNQLQTTAFRRNNNVLKPKDGHLYKKINLIDTNRVSNILAWIKLFAETEDLLNKINEIVGLLTFDETADHFEEGIKELGVALGYESQRPDKENGEGPDNLWALGSNDYLIIDCKNEVEEKRDEISKKETGQINTHCGWFKNNYSGVIFKAIMIIHTKNISKQGAFNFDVEILRKAGLKELRNNFKSFYDSLKEYDLQTLTGDIIQKLLIINKLDNNSIKTKYTEKPYQRK